MDSIGELDSNWDIDKIHGLVHDVVLSGALPPFNRSYLVPLRKTPPADKSTMPSVPMNEICVFDSTKVMDQ